MIKFENESFQSFNYTKGQINNFFNNAKKDFELAKKSDSSDVIYRIAYDAVLKLGIAIIAKKGYKTRSVQGHHIKILNKMGKILNLEDEINYLHRVRRKRNIDLYEGGVDFTKKESDDLIVILTKIFRSAC